MSPVKKCRPNYLKLPPNDSHFWYLARFIVVFTLAVVGVSVGYKQGWVTRSDLPVVLTIAAGLLGVDGTQFLSHRRARRKAKSTQKESSDAIDRS